MRVLLVDLVVVSGSGISPRTCGQIVG